MNLCHSFTLWYAFGIDRHGDNRCGANELMMVVRPPTIDDTTPKPTNPRQAQTSNFDIDDDAAFDMAGVDAEPF